MMRQALYECPNDKKKKVVSVPDNEAPARTQTCSFCYGDMALVKTVHDASGSSPIPNSQTF